MKVFLAGASGVIGRRLVPQLLDAGHEVTGMTRSDASAERLREAGVEPVVCDAFDPAALEAAVAAARPEAVIHQLTALPDRIDPRRTDFGPNNRIRTEGTDNLVAASRAAGARRFVAQSIAFMYEPAPGLAGEDAPLVGPDGAFAGTTRANEELERRVTSADDLEGVVLRFGYFYGTGSAFGEGGSQVEDVGRRRFPVIGDGGGVFSFVHVDDAATATVAALEGTATGVFNIVDDEPSPVGEWLPVFAESIGAKPPRHVPEWLGRLVGGPRAIATTVHQRGASNATAKRELGWAPRWPSWRQGFLEAPR